MGAGGGLFTVDSNLMRWPLYYLEVLAHGIAKLDNYRIISKISHSFSLFCFIPGGGECTLGSK
jgi:hypothetical protein